MLREHEHSRDHRAANKAPGMRKNVLYDRAGCRRGCRRKIDGGLVGNSTV